MRSWISRLPPKTKRRARPSITDVKRAARLTGGFDTTLSSCGTTHEWFRYDPLLVRYDSRVVSIRPSPRAVRLTSGFDTTLSSCGTTHEWFRYDPLLVRHDSRVVPIRPSPRATRLTSG